MSAESIAAILDRACPVRRYASGAPWSSPVERVVCEALAAHFSPPPVVPVEQWLRERITLTSEQTAEYADEPFDIERIPHARILLDFLADPHAEELSIMKSSSASLSSATIAALIHKTATSPGSIIYLISNREEAIKLSKKFWRPWLRQVFGAETDTEEQGNLHVQVNGISIFSGSPTESMMRNKQVEVLVEDEGDTMPETLLGGGQDLDTAERERTKNVRVRKIIRLCTPLFEFQPGKPKMDQPKCRIHRHFLQGDQREYRCPCPHCGNENPIKFEHLQFEHCKDLAGDWLLDDIERETFWQCPSCSGKVFDASAEKRAMIRAGRWVPTVAARSRRFWSAHHTDTISLLGSVTWGRIASEMMRTSGTMEQTGVKRSYLAQPESLVGGSAGRDREQILRHCGTHERGTCPVVPWGGLALLVDVNRDLEKESTLGGVHLRFPWMIGAIAREPAGALYVIDWGEAEDYDDLFLRDKDSRVVNCLFAKPVNFRPPAEQWAKFHPGKQIPTHLWIQRGLIDSGYQARGGMRDGDASEQSVYGLCLRTFVKGRFCICPVKGRAGVQWTTAGVVVESSAQVRGFNIPVYHYDDWAMKSDLNVRLSSDPAKPSPLARRQPRIVFPRPSDVTDALIEHLTPPLQSQGWRQIEIWPELAGIDRFVLAKNPTSAQ